jgi:hypothetical protein
MPASPGSGAHRDDFWHRQEARQDGGVGLADPQGHERDELAAEGAEVKALAEGFERAVSGEMPQPGVDSQEPGEGEPFGIGERPPERARSGGRQARRRAGGPARHRSRLQGLRGAGLVRRQSATVRSAFFATEGGTCPQHPDRRWRVRHNPC